MLQSIEGVPWKDIDTAFVDAKGADVGWARGLRFKLVPSVSPIRVGCKTDLPGVHLCWLTAYYCYGVNHRG